MLEPPLVDVQLWPSSFGTLSLFRSIRFFRADFVVRVKTAMLPTLQRSRLAMKDMSKGFQGRWASGRWQTGIGCSTLGIPGFHDSLMGALSELSDLYTEKYMGCVIACT